MLKVTCPRCKESLEIPDKFAGKAVRCPACNRAIRVPEPPEQKSDDPARKLDYGSLEAIEGEGMTLERKRKLFQRKMSLKEAREASGEPDEIAAALEQDPTLRFCPHCHAKVHAPDAYVEVICTACDKPIPSPLEAETVSAIYTGSLRGRMTAPVTFYTGFLSSVLYPFPAMIWILLGIIVALAAIVLPVGVVLAFAAGTALNPLNAGVDFGWVGPFLTGMFILEGLYFGAVNYHILIDSIRTTASGGEVPPALTFNPTSLGTAFAGYLAIGLYYFVMLFLLFFVANRGAFALPTTHEQLQQLRTPGNYFILGLVTFMVPMNLVGLASSRWVDGLNPSRVVRSILACFAHYTFLFMIVLVFLGAYTGVMLGVMEWAIGAVLDAAKNGIQQGLMTLVGGLGAWAVVIGAGLFFTYSLGRLIGLFVRTYREHLDFDI